MRILITGSSGFLGKNIVELFRLLYPEHTLLLPNRHNLNAMMHEKPELIIHLAANSSPRCDINDPDAIYSIYNDNIQFTYKLLSMAPKGCKFVFASSILVYGDSKNRKFEDEYCQPLSIYAGTKMACEDICFAHHNIGRNPCLVLRYGPIVGKYQTHGLLLDVLKKLYSDSDKIEIIGKNPGSYRSYLHVSDAARITIDLALSEEDGIYNVALQDEISVSDVVYLAQTQTQTFKHVDWIEKNSIEDINYIAVSNYKLRKNANVKFEYLSSFLSIAQGIDDLWHTLKV